MKACFKCKVVQPLSEFYRHPKMADGHLGKCKSCAKRDVKLNYRKRFKKYQKYEVARSGRPARKLKQLEHQRRWRRENPEKEKAHRAVAYAIQTGRLKKKQCEGCGARKGVHAHHDDYSKPLDVRWVCAQCHRSAHGTSRHQVNP